MTKKIAQGKKAAPKVTSKSSSTKGKKPTRKLNAAFMAALKPSASLAAIIGTKPQPRTKIVQDMWVYIRKQGLQDQANKRMINTDDKLKALVNGQSQISMFDLAKVISAHVTKA